MHFCKNTNVLHVGCSVVLLILPSVYKQVLALADISCSSLAAGRFLSRAAAGRATSEQVMKPQEAELVSEISKLQGMVSELKSGFSGALMELSQIQHGDSDLREELQENRRSCRKKALRVEALVEALREELGVMSGQILQLYRPKPLQEDKSATAKSGDGLKAGLSEGTDARHQVAMQLLHSEWEYVSTLNQLYDKYRKPPDHLMTLEP
ncbi:Rho guanine nucleotide exchange factor 33 [Dissostichus eleginoides]|uniref:Rho guanine nucleotide exchange factor 33 n=1 Tax=Dissostichus eleginoides TaxID=100907 RepID=A0AAD9C2F9_DISEL|nr:Rho guanine nucleotide exchange factor 33 [Dissostichus eleginoides]